LGVLAFSLTVPLTSVAVRSGLSPAFVGSARAVVAAALAAFALGLARPRVPRGGEWVRLVVVAGGVVLGFPLLTSAALRSVPASHAAVMVGLLPAATAVLACLRTGERPRPRFWWACAAGAAACVAFVAIQGGGLGGVGLPDLLLLAAVVSCAAGYAEGGLLSRALGSWQTISWALLLALPVNVVVTTLSWHADPPAADVAGWAAFAYLGVVSMFLGFLAWYRGLALGPLLSVSQIQLGQPLLSLLWAAFLLGEGLGPAALLGGLAVVGCTALAVRSR